MEAPLLILASASPRRSELLRQLRPRFQIVPSPAAETRGEHWSAGELAQVNACRKARAVSKQFPDALVIGVDTLVAVGTTSFGKPRTRAEARDMLAFLQGRTHQVTTGVCLLCMRARRQRVFYEQTDVAFRALTPAQIRRYHQKELFYRLPARPLAKFLIRAAPPELHLGHSGSTPSTRRTILSRCDTMTVGPCGPQWRRP